MKKMIYYFGITNSYILRGCEMKSIYPNLDSLMEEREIDYLDLATEIGVADTTMYRRLKGKSDMKLHEAFEICKYFDNFDVEWIFRQTKV